MYESADTLLAPQFAEVVKKAAQPLFQPIYDLEVPKMNFGRIALLGDAAFVVRPHCGMGVTKAAGDALAIVEALERQASVEEALADYSEQRCRFGASIVQHARHLGAYMQAQLKSEEEREMAGVVPDSGSRDARNGSAREVLIQSHALRRREPWNMHIRKTVARPCPLNSLKTLFKIRFWKTRSFVHWSNSDEYFRGA
jgi:2-polyprenyl-6-methoxyphenol hydroxylase-like FAD-dependent oxidoreductase